jgi:hypothetical protein
VRQLIGNLEIKTIQEMYKGNEYFVRSLMILMVLEITRVLMLVQTIVVPYYYSRNAGTNKARMVEYLNATVKMLIKRQLDKKSILLLPIVHL